MVDDADANGGAEGGSMEVGHRGIQSGTEGT